MGSRIATILLSVGLLGSLLSLAPQAAGWRPPGNRQGYEPVQPIAYSHRLHAGELEIPCQYCHTGADKSRHAGLPAVETCLKCHGSVKATKAQRAAEDERAKAAGEKPRPVISPELAKLYEAAGWTPDGEPDPRGTPQPVPWARVHLLPDFVYFNHEAHVNRGVPCQKCHGPVQAMDRVRQTESLTMGWCVDCHRQTTRQGLNGHPVRTSTDCVTCHY